MTRLEAAEYGKCKELAAMERLLRVVTSAVGRGSDADVSKNFSPAERLRVLQYGFSSRTYQTLSQHFPRLKRSMLDDRWRELGRLFCESEATKCLQLGLLPLAFCDWLLKQELSSAEIFQCKLDMAVFEIGLVTYGSGANLDLDNLREETRLRLKPTVRLMFDQEFYVVSRNNADAFVDIIPENWHRILVDLGTQISCVELADRFDSVDDFGAFLSRAVHFHWLEVSDNH